MQLFGNCVFEQQEKITVSRRGQAVRRQAGKRLYAIAVVLLVWTAGISSGYAQAGAGASAPDKAASDLPSAPTVVLTEPMNLRPSARDFSKPAGSCCGHSIQDVYAHQHRQGQLCKLCAAD